MHRFGYSKGELILSPTADVPNGEVYNLPDRIIGDREDLLTLRNDINAILFPKELKLITEYWVGGFYSYSIIRADGRPSGSSCLHRHKTIEAALACGRPAFRRLKKGES